MKYCKKCDEIVNDDARVCPCCGGELTDGVTVENAESPVFGEVVTAEDSAQTCETDNIETLGFDAEQDENELYICYNCGNALEVGQNFCTQCGTPREDVKLTCKKCGAELQAGQAFCMHCGQKTEMGTNAAEQKRKITMTPKTAVIAAVAVIFLGAIITFFATNVFMSVDRLCERGDYEKAYEKASSDEQKLEVIAENAAAVQSAVTSEMLVDPSSFELYEACYAQAPLSSGEIGAELLYLKTDQNKYFVYGTRYGESNWLLLDSLSDLNRSSTDDWKNESIEYIEFAKNYGIKLKDDAVERINDMFHSKELDKIKLLDVY